MKKWWQNLVIRFGRWLARDYPTITFPAAGIDPNRIRVIERHYRIGHDSRITMPETHASIQDRELKNVIFGVIATLLKDELIIVDEKQNPSDLSINYTVRLLVIDPNHER